VRAGSGTIDIAMKQLLLATAVAIAAAGAPSSAQAPSVSSAQPAPADVATPPPDAVKTASGLVSRVLKPGPGPDQPAPTDFVTVHYEGWTRDGTPVDSSRSRGTPSMFPLNRSLLGWRECVQLMKVGETRRCWLPETLAYQGEAGRPRGAIVFDIELLETRTAPTIPPPDVAGPPDDAMRTASGLAYKVLKAGTGPRTPASWNRVTVHYTGWTTDGKMFDSSVSRGTAATLSLDEVIEGWKEGMQLMVEGERRRFWIPEALAYKGEAGSPRGMLVFDVDLIKIE
jgi:peptidylprolyl isomerase